MSYFTRGCTLASAAAKTSGVKTHWFWHVFKHVLKHTAEIGRVCFNTPRHHLALRNT